MFVIRAEFKDEFAKNNDLKQEYFDKLKEWFQSQPHLPEISDLQLAIFYHSCYYSNEATKTCIDNYYTCRALCPELFANRDPTNNELVASYKNLYIFVLPKNTYEGYSVIYARLKTFKPEDFILHILLKIFDMLVSLIHRQEGSKPGVVIVIDTKHITLGHLVRLNPLIIKKFLYYLQAGLPVRLQGLHFVNCVPFMDRILALIKPFMKEDLLNMLTLHEPNTKTIFKYVPQECFMDEFGGTAGSINKFHETQIKNLKENREFFLKEEAEIADESKRVGRAKNAGDVFGVEGTFKKLDID